MNFNEIYLDNAATTCIEKEVLKEMIPFLKENYGNPSSFHNKGKKAKEAIEGARKRVARVLNCSPKEIIFTSGGSESINLALKGIAFANKERGNHILTSKIEHHAVLETCKFLEKIGFKITYLDVDKYGLINPKDVEKAINEKTILVSIMYANNEIGTIEPIEKIAKITKKKGVYFHTDACQAAGFLDLNVEKLGVDLLSLNGSKLCGPKGTGVLYLKEGMKIEPLIHGGGQENGIRAGTENVAGIVGFAKALEMANKNKEKNNKKLTKLRDYFIEGILKIPSTKLNGHPKKRLPNNLNVSFLGVEGESIILHLNEKKVYASTGSACASQNLETSHVLSAIGLPHEMAHGSVRFSLSKKTTKKEIDFVLRIIPKIIEHLRKISPIYTKEVCTNEKN